MASLFYEKIVWISQVRGLTSAERNVLRFLCDQSNAIGQIQKLYARTIGNACEFQRTRVFEILKSLERKRFVIDRNKRFGTRGVRLSNGYQLDFDRNHPPDLSPVFHPVTGKVIDASDDGATVGAHMLRLAAADLKPPEEIAQDLESAFKHSDAYFNPTRRMLSVWVESRPESGAFHRMRLELQSSATSWEIHCGYPPPLSFEFLAPKGATQIVAPRDRGKRRKTAKVNDPIMFSEPPEKVERYAEPWRELLNDLFVVTDPQSFNTWWRPARMVGWEDSTLLVEVPNQYFIEWLSDHSAQAVELIKERFPGVERIEFINRSGRTRPQIPSKKQAR